MARKAIVVLILLGFVGIGLLGSSKTFDPKECFWEIIIQVKSNGTYSLDQTKASYSGKYAYAIQWSGCMEQDGQDFILYHENSELVRWKSKEQKKALDTADVKITEEFSEKPSFAFNYILTKEDNIHFDFLIKGFRIPQLDKNPRHYLHLPASKENSYHPTDIAYNLHINKGSNQVYFNKDDLLEDSSKKDFYWSWKRHSSSSSEEEPSYLTHSYDVYVEISILRRLKKQPTELFIKVADKFLSKQRSISKIP